MTGEQFADIRKATGLGVVAFGRALGYEGNMNTVSVLVRAYEGGKKPVPPTIRRLARMFEMHGVPADWVREPRS